MEQPRQQDGQWPQNGLNLGLGRSGRDTIFQVSGSLSCGSVQSWEDFHSELPVLAGLLSFVN